MVFFPFFSSFFLLFFLFLLLLGFKGGHSGGLKKWKWGLNDWDGVVGSALADVMNNSELGVGQSMIRRVTNGDCSNVECLLSDVWNCAMPTEKRKEERPLNARGFLLWGGGLTQPTRDSGPARPR